MEVNKIEIKVLSLSLVSIILIETAAHFITSLLLYPSLIFLGVVRFFETVQMILIVIIWGKGIASIGLASSKMIPGFKKGLIWSVAIGLSTTLAYGLLFGAGIHPMTFIRVHMPENQSDIILLFFIGGVIGPIAEEVFFRAILYGFFRKWGLWMALVLSTLIFVAVHLDLTGFRLAQLAG